MIMAINVEPDEMSQNPVWKMSHFMRKPISAVIHLLFWAYGSWDSLFPISMGLTANL